MRTRGSARFAPYFKVQVFENYCLAWVDIQCAHPTQDTAEATLPPSGRARIVAVTERGRRVVAEYDCRARLTA
jgi:hypothetical protein